MSFLKTIEQVIRGKELSPLPTTPVFGYNHKHKTLTFRQPVSFEEVTKEIEGTSEEAEEDDSKSNEEEPRLIDELGSEYWLMYLKTATARKIAPREAVTQVPSVYFNNAEIMLEFIRLEPQGILVATESLKQSREFMKAAYQIAPSIIALLDGREDISPEIMHYLIQQEELDIMARSVKLNFPDTVSLSH